jgi:hypothetical protein
VSEPTISNTLATVQPAVAAGKGSQRRLQEWIDWRADELRRRLAEWRSLEEWRAGPVKWIAPVRDEGFKELRDDLWAKADLPPPTPQADGFWPRRGPAWDAVATIAGPDDQEGILLVEAKSHVAELESPATKAGKKSRPVIQAALDETKAFIGAPPNAPWLDTYYQVANRLAFLYYLRVRRSLPAWLLSIYFVGDSFESRNATIVGPTTADGWAEAIHQAEATLMLPAKHPLSPYASHLFLPADPITGVRSSGDGIEA